jgi:secreted protein with Ig-like and vWFA domain
LKHTRIELKSEMIFNLGNAQKGIKKMIDAPNTTEKSLQTIKVWLQEAMKSVEIGISNLQIFDKSQENVVETIALQDEKDKQKQQNKNANKNIPNQEKVHKETKTILVEKKCEENNKEELPPKKSKRKS